MRIRNQEGVYKGVLEAITGDSKAVQTTLSPETLVGAGDEVVITDNPVPRSDEGFEKRCLWVLQQKY